MRVSFNLIFYIDFTVYFVYILLKTTVPKGSFPSDVIEGSLKNLSVKSS